MKPRPTLAKDHNRPQGRGEQNLRVFVLNKRGKPLMPCSSSRARILLKEKNAVVVRRSPFTIQLTIATDETKQPVSLGVDAGYKHVGLSAATKKAELYASEVELLKRYQDAGLKNREIAQYIGKSETYVSRMLQLAELPDEVKKIIQIKSITSLELMLVINEQYRKYGKEFLDELNNIYEILPT